MFPGGRVVGRAVVEQLHKGPHPHEREAIADMEGAAALLRHVHIRHNLHTGIDKSWNILSVTAHKS